MRNALHMHTAYFSYAYVEEEYNANTMGADGIKTIRISSMQLGKPASSSYRMLGIPRCRAVLLERARGDIPKRKWLREILREIFPALSVNLSKKRSINRRHYPIHALTGKMYKEMSGGNEINGYGTQNRWAWQNCVANGTRDKTVDIEKGDSLEIFMDGNKIVLQKHEPGCVFCGETQNVRTVKEKTLCQRCLNDIKGCV